MVSSESHLGWLKRNGGYVFWSTAEQVANMALPRLVLFPLSAYFIGKEQFGIFMTAVSVTSIIGTQPQAGLGDGLLKHFADYSEDQRTQFCATSMRLCHKAMVAIVATSILAMLFAMVFFTLPKTLTGCMVPLVLSLYPENQFALLFTKTRFDRQFQTRTLWALFRAPLVCICAIIGAIVSGAIGMAWGFMLGNTAAYIVVRLRYRVYYQSLYNPEMAAVLKNIWLQMTIAGTLMVAGPYINRVILAFYNSYGDVAELVAATSVMFLFLTPVSCSSIFLMSMISKYTSISQFSYKARVAWFSIMFLGVFVLPGLLFLFGNHIMAVLFPKFGEGPSRLLHILICVVAFQTLISLIRPFVIKFASIKIIPIINGASLAIILITAFLLIPSYGTVGAAWAIVVSNLITALLWMLVIWRLYSRRPIEIKA